jgi:hypothetical protein
MQGITMSLAPSDIAPLRAASPPSGEAGSWAIRRVGLRYHLGERKLFEVGLRLAVNTTHFTAIPENTYLTLTDWSGLPTDIDGVLVRSQPVTERLPRFTRQGKVIRYVPQQYQRYYMEFGKTFEQYLQKFSSQTRSKRKKEVRKFAESCGGEIDMREYRSVEEVTEFIDLARELSRKTFQERLLGVGLPATETYRKFLLEKAATGHIRAYMLFHKGVPASFLLNEVRDPGIVMSLYTGYDPQFRTLGAGSIVYYLAFERLFAESGLRMLDFTEGEGTHKQFFATGSKQCADIFFFPATLRIQALLGLQTTLDNTTRAVGALLDRMGLKQKIKNLLRARA